MSTPEDTKQATLTESHDRPPPRKRFLVRAFCCILIPPAFAAYYVWTYLTWLRSSSDPATDIDKPVPNGRYVWWSWFIIGAIGLNVSNYVLAGVEAGMLMSQRFGPLKSEQIIMHKDKSWSKISGWKDGFTTVIMRKPRGAALSWIWIVLFVLSMLSWAFVLSGLTMETRDSFKAGSVLGVDVVGTDMTNFNHRDPYHLIETAYEGWGQGRRADIPLIGTLYSPPGYSIAYNMSTGNELPSDASSQIFLAPQAEIPLTGTAWGVAYKYRCLPVAKLSDFTILAQRLNSSVPGTIWKGDVLISEHYFYNVDAGATISVLRALSSPVNIGTVAEIGLSAGIESLMHRESRGYTPHTYHGLDDEDVIEYALWQDTRGTGGSANVTGTIPELAGQYENYVGTGMFAIGVRCTSASAAGTAKLNGIAGTFSNFEREDPSTTGINPPPRFGLTVASVLLQGPTGFTHLTAGPGLEPLTSAFTFLSTNINYTLVNEGRADWTPSLYTACGIQSSDGTNFRRNAYPDDLQRALIDAHKHAAIQLMFDDQDNIGDAWRHPNLTAAVPWTILVSAEDGVPPLLVLVMLLLWALACVVLGVTYGFRRRWEAWCDTASLYWYCVEIAKVDPVDVLRTP